MVQAPTTTAQQRWRSLAAENSVGKGVFASTRPSQPPKITYGRKATKALSLTGGQFRGSAYDIPSDDEEEDEESSPLFVEARRTRGESDSGADESGLSDGGAAVQDAPTGSHRIVNAPGKKRAIRKPRQTKESQKTRSKEQISAPPRRLPVNELFLVASPPNYPINDPLSSCPGVEVQDPINDFSSSPRKRSVSPIESEDDLAVHKVVKTPLTTIRKRIQTPKWKHKPVTIARKPKEETRSLLMRYDYTEPRGRDGFDASELLITGSRKLRKVRTPRTPLIPKFDALQLKSGPLPNVEFESSVKLELQTQDCEADDVPVYSENDLHQDLFPERRVSFSSGLRNDAIRAQLSSISAPERDSSESGESDAEGEHGDDVEEYDSEEDETDRASIDEVEKRAVVGEDITEQPENVGVTLDFRRPEMPGQASIARSLQRRHLMEVHESIVEVPDTSPTRCGPRGQVNQGQQRRVDVQTPHRPRSILKNSTPMVPESTTTLEQTAANTRRSSIVDLDESRYFAVASNALHESDPARHIIIPRRPSHFNYAEVEVPDSDRIIPETSPARTRYTDPQLNVLRRTSEAVWTSSSCNTGHTTKNPADLKTLTRSVSREHGTLSQAVRRRPSLSFHSPTKIR